VSAFPSPQRVQRANKKTIGICMLSDLRLLSELRLHAVAVKADGAGPTTCQYAFLWSCLEHRIVPPFCITIVGAPRGRNSIIVSPFGYHSDYGSREMTGAPHGRTGQEQLVCRSSLWNSLGAEARGHAAMTNCMVSVVSPSSLPSPSCFPSCLARRVMGARAIC